ncbi:MULE transposase domain [Sesbania bispinosa]|nr:MULE transposase domain [Sesbania bispinosa]
MKVRIDVVSGRWRVSKFFDEQNHILLGGIHTGMLSAHRKMTDVDIMQMNSLRNVGRQRMMQSSDVKGAFQYLRDMAFSNRPMYWSHTLDSDGRLMCLFWCDGHSQLDYKVFGNVLAFDATYKKNKYHFPLVIFSGINHHNQTTVFASGVIADETEETYVWLLEQLMVAMKDKTPVSFITDGDLAMRNAIKRVFPNAHHRLCAWHLLRNANSNMKNTKFLSIFKKLMLGDYEIYEFERRWGEIVVQCGLEENTWVQELYEKKGMWASCYIRGNFFAGIRTTSRCKGLHAQLGKFIHSRNMLVDFLQNLHHCVESIRYKEIEADYVTVVREPVLQTNLPTLERMDSFGLPCEHIVGVLVHLNIDDIPNCIVLERWTIKVNRLAARSTVRFNVIRDLLTEELHKLEIPNQDGNGGNETCNDASHGQFRDPVQVGSKGCAASSTMDGSQRRQRQKCGLCGGVGHNRKTCSLQGDVEHVLNSQQGSNQHYDDRNVYGADTFTFDPSMGFVPTL